jgi:hypothetical protein
VGAENISSRGQDLIFSNLILSLENLALKIIPEEIIFSHSEDSNNKLIIICKNYYTLILHGGESLNLDADERFFSSNRQSTRAPQYNLIPCHSHARTNVATMLQTSYLSSLSHFFPVFMTSVRIETISFSREVCAGY